MSEENKIVVRRFNQQVIAEGSRQAFEELVAPRFINRSAPAGTPNDRESLWRTFNQILFPALTDLQVRIEDQIAERDWVTTRKTITGVHSGELLGVAASGKNVTIAVIDMVRIEDGQYVEHWGLNTLAHVVNQLKQD
ncbi:MULTISPECIES: ester cyclase [Pantoea]|jgi:predicted ester cyclase|uniref:ester cyclase n=1 Tax=Pantoea TaxID=53335 RepID=UPI000EA10F1E|nr:MULTISPECIES: ester cyclase [Pantoea]MBZ6384920.1 ester cyclase [Pantoea piersonii]MBZ6400891.1 ester cyclase [Pantoea piersonii]MBZ6407755.1 ester cyclase [Pantoea piersonii]MBZ6426831.1 ester cyclase [Pantoea piersonii]NYB03201.1 ester cyclase [Pantoea piersonii]